MDKKIIYQIQDIGKRDNMQDNIFSFEVHEGNCNIVALAVADGLGSFVNSHLASGFITGTLEKWLQDNWETELSSKPFNEIKNTIKSLITEIHSKLLYLAKVKEIDFGSTLTFLLLLENTYLIAQVGDSRCYLYQRGILRQLTKDQTMGREFRSRQMDGEEDILKADSTLMQCMGHGSMVPELYEGVCEPDSKFILCSDGLINKIPHDEIKEVLKLTEQDGDYKLSRLLEKARKRGERDNISALLIE